MAVQFNATTQYVTVPIPARSFPLTLSCWGNRPAGSVNVALVSVGSAVGQRFQLTHLSGQFAAASQTSAGTSQATIGQFPQLQWNWCAGQLLADNNRWAYFNNVTPVQNTSSRALGSSLNEIMVGARRNESGPGAFWNGQLANVGVWGAILTADELKALYAGFLPSVVRMQDLLAEFIFTTTEIIETTGKLVTVVSGPLTQGADKHPRTFTY